MARRHRPKPHRAALPCALAALAVALAAAAATLAGLLPLIMGEAIIFATSLPAAYAGSAWHVGERDGFVKGLITCSYLGAGLGCWWAGMAELVAR